MTQPTLQRRPLPTATPFTTIDELRTLAQAVELVEPGPVTVNGIQFPRHKGLFFQPSHRPATVVRRRFTVVQNRFVLQAYAKALEQVGTRPSGRVHESDQGVLHLQSYFPHPEHRLDIALGVADEQDMVYLGLGVKNSYGEPYACVQFDVIGYHLAQGDQGHYLRFGALVRSITARHTGQVRTRAHEAFHLMVTQAPHITESLRAMRDYTFPDAKSLHACLGALGFGPRFQQAVFHRATDQGTQPQPSAWAVYNVIARLMGGKDASPTTKEDYLTRGARLIDVPAIPALIKAGQDAALQDRLETNLLQEPLAPPHPAASAVQRTLTDHADTDPVVAA